MNCFLNITETQDGEFPYQWQTGDMWLPHTYKKKKKLLQNDKTRVILDKAEKEDFSVS